MNDSQQLREQMWDLTYGLLSPEESTALIAHIKSDPQAARLYAEIRLQADLVGYASRVEDSSLVLKVGESLPQLTLAKSQVGGARKHSASVGSGAESRRGASWLVGVAATALAVLLAIGYLWPQPNEQQLAINFVVTDIESPAAMSAGLTTKLGIHTATLDGEGRPAIVQLRLTDSAGADLLRQHVETNDIGRGSVEIPGDKLAPGARLEVVAVGSAADAAMNARQNKAAISGKEEDEHVLLAADLPVQPEPQVAYFLFSEPIASAEQEQKFSCWNYLAFSGKPAPMDASTQEVEKLAELLPVESKGLAEREFNITNGSLPKAKMPAHDSLSLVPAQNAPGPAEASLSKTLGDDKPANSYRFNAVQPLNPAAPRLEQKDFGVRLRQLADQKRGDNEVPASGRGTDPQPDGGTKTDAEKQTSIVAAKQPIQIEVPADQAGKSLTAIAVCRGVTVATTVGDAKPADVAARSEGESARPPGEKLSLDLPPEADGPIEVSLFDRSRTPPQLVEQYSFYRQPARKLQIELADVQQQFLPGEHVRLNLQVTDEAGQPAANTLVGVRVWNEALVRQAVDQPLLLAGAASASGATSQLRRDDNYQPAKELAGSKVAAIAPASPGGEIERKKAEQPQEGDKTETKSDALAFQEAFMRRGGLAASAAPQPSTSEAAFALTELTRPKAIVLASNRQQVQAERTAVVASAHEQRQDVMQSLGRAALGGGVLLLILLGLVTLLRMPSSGRVSIPSLAVAAAGLLLGLAWIGAKPQLGEREIALATRPAPAEDSAANTPAPSASPASPTTADPRRRSVVPPAAAEVAAAMPADARSLASKSVPTPGSGPAPLPALVPSAGGGAGAPASPTPDAPRQSGGGLGGGGGTRPIGGLAGAAPSAAKPESAREVRDLDRAEAEKEKAQSQAALGAVKALASAAPAAIYFNPQLLTDAAGRVTIEFNMPPVAAEYRVLIDALGHGRIGSQQQVIVCKGGENK